MTDGQCAVVFLEGVGGGEDSKGGVTVGQECGGGGGSVGDIEQDFEVVSGGEGDAFTGGVECEDLPIDVDGSCDSLESSENFAVGGGAVISLGESGGSAATSVRQL